MANIETFGELNSESRQIKHNGILIGTLQQKKCIRVKKSASSKDVRYYLNLETHRGKQLSIGGHWADGQGMTAVAERIAGFAQLPVKTVLNGDNAVQLSPFRTNCGAMPM